jgi:uncharacterized membrane protein
MATESSRSTEQLAQGLGWFSLGLGTSQVLLPGLVNRVAGVKPTRATRRIMRIIGLRELGAGAGIFATEPGPLLWGRVAGDAMDLALLLNALRSRHARRTALVFASVIGITALDVYAASQRTRQVGKADSQLRSPMEAKAAITIKADPETLYAEWHQFERLPAFMYHLESVSTDGDGRSHWVAKGPAGTKVEWDAEIVDDVPGRRISWQSTENATVANAGSVRFERAPRDQGTEMHVELTYSPPAGPLGAAVAKLFGEEPNQQLRDDLRRFKQIIETGEIARSDGAPQGSTVKNVVMQREAAPLEEVEA